MATKHVMLEVNLTSNDVILNTKGDNHPFMLYRKYGVPVALSTDDEGVSRIDLTHEYVRAAVTYPLAYRDFKQMVRTSIEHSFLPGASLWQSSTPEKLDQPLRSAAGSSGATRPLEPAQPWFVPVKKRNSSGSLNTGFISLRHNSRK